MSSPRTSFLYRPGKWPMRATLVAGACYVFQIWQSGRHGADVSQAAFLHVFVILLLAVLPMLIGTVCWALGRFSQRAGDVGFSIVMLAQGIALVICSR